MKLTKTPIQNWVLIFMAGVAFVGCGKGSQNSTGEAYAPNQSDDLEALWSCQYGGAQIDACLSLRDSNFKRRLKTTFGIFDQAGRWVYQKIDLPSVRARYPLSTEEKACIQNTICRKENP